MGRYKRHKDNIKTNLISTELRCPLHISKSICGNQHKYNINKIYGKKGKT